MKKCRKPHKIKVGTWPPGVEVWSYCDKMSHEVHVRVPGVDYICFKLPAFARHGRIGLPTEKP
jgi:hypothetical protein